MARRPPHRTRPVRAPGPVDTVGLKAWAAPLLDMVPLEAAGGVDALAINTAGWAVTLAGLGLTLAWTYYLYR